LDGGRTDAADVGRWVEGSEGMIKTALAAALLAAAAALASLAQAKARVIQGGLLIDGTADCSTGG
jgi:hypothetical protein